MGKPSKDLALSISAGSSEEHPAAPAIRAMAMRPIRSARTVGFLLDRV
jgi:hypothetical protein